ncbi:MAG: ROK family protein, partial [Anaerolineales bacterium]|nr:ROK family protein [Anaerolineales bacterium]
MPLWGGIEGGGTKFVCAIANDAGEILELTNFPTTTPAETIDKAIAFFEEYQAEEPLQAIGVSTFGPVDLDQASSTYGYITTTPKPGWANTDVVGEIKRAFNLPVGFDTDVNGAALAEYRWGAARGLHTFVYLTIGTGIGGGGMVNGQLIHGMIHPEMGHMLMRRDPEKDPYEGFCPYHGD